MSQVLAMLHQTLINSQWYLLYSCLNFDRTFSGGNYLEDSILNPHHRPTGTS